MREYRPVYEYLRSPHPPIGATICTVKQEGSNTVVNVAGFKYPFPSPTNVAKFLDIPWKEFDRMILLNATNASMILIRKDHLEKWHLSSEGSEQ